MANFKTHLNGAFVVSGILGLIAYKAELIGDHEFLICIVFGTIGGLLPDIDSDRSTPIRMGFNFVALFVAFSLVIHWRSELSVVSLILLWLAGYAFMNYAVFKLFTKFTVHRGIIHSVPYMLALALGLVCFIHYVMDSNVIISWLYGLFVFVGAMVHLLLDEAYSVDLLNHRIKRSSGTAMKFYQQRQQLHYFVLYAVIVLLIFIAPSVKPFWYKLSNPMTWQLLQYNIVPNIPDKADVLMRLPTTKDEVDPPL